MKLELHHLQKHYKQLHVLKDINLNFREGVYGLVGPNGAGKSTLMRLLVAAEFPESGEILWEGKNIREHRNDYKLRIGYLPQEFGFYKEFTGREMLHYTGLIKTVLPMEEIREQSSRLLELLDLMDKADVAVGKYSGGMKQRLGIAQAFLGYPDLVILDEATVGLDPMQRIRFKKFLKEYGKEKTVILSTHILSDLKDIADFLIFMDKGNIIYNGMMDREKNPDELYMNIFIRGRDFVKRNFLFIGYELKYLFRQRFLQFLVLMICLFTIYGTPTGVYSKDWDYGIYDRYEKQQSYENMTENQITAIEFAKMRIEDILSQRNRIYETAVEQKKNLEHQEGYEWEYLTKAEEVYGKEISLKPRDYRGWESYFASKVMMLQHSKMALFTLMILVSSGLFLLSKDRTNRTLFWASYTGKGAAWSSYSMKLLAIFLYGFCVQFIQIAVQILTLVFISKYDMRQWLEPIQNISAFGTCCFTLNMIELLLLHIVLLNVAALFVILFTMLLIRILKRDLLLIICGMGVTGSLYAHVYACDKSRVFDFLWRINPLSVVQMDQVLQYGAWNVAGHAVFVQAGVACIWVMMLAALYVGAYQMWRRYLNETGV